MIWSDVSYVLRSSLSRKILKSLEKEPLAPVQIAKKTGIDKSNVSTKIRELAKRGMLECINPEDRKYRFYRITDHGKKVMRTAEMER